MLAQAKAATTVRKVDASWPRGYCDVGTGMFTLVVWWSAMLIIEGTNSHQALGDFFSSSQCLTYRFLGKMTSNTSRKIVVKEKRDLKELLQSESSISAEEGKSRRRSLLASLGDGVIADNIQEEYTITTLHGTYAKTFNDPDGDFDADDKIEAKLLENATDTANKKTELEEPRRHLLAIGHYGQNILHVIFTCSHDRKQNSYGPDGTLNFDKLKPFVGFLARLKPDLLLEQDWYKRTPLFLALNSSKIDQQAKKEIVSYLCSQSEPPIFDELVLEKARKSLTIVGKMDREDIVGYHALHLAIKGDVAVNEKVVEKLSNVVAEGRAGKKEQRSCFELRDLNGSSCLHLALTEPFSEAKISWARNLVTFQPDLLTIAGAGKPASTPLQHFAEQMEKRDKERKASDKRNQRNEGSEALDAELVSLVDWLKYQCLLKYNDAAKNIMYRKGNSEHDTRAG
jgi:hypothetical protein